MQRMKPAEIDIGAIHHIDGAGFRHDHVEGMNVVQLAIRDVDETRDVAPQIQQGVHLHRRLGGAEMRPREDRQAQVDGRCVQGVDGVGKFQTQILAGVQLAGPGDQPLRHFRMDAPVAPFVGIGQGRASNRLAEAHVVKFRRMHRQAYLDIAQAFPVAQLGKGHGAVLLGAGQRPHPVIAAVPLDNPGKGRPRQEIHDLREHRLAGVHGHLQAETWEIAPARSSSRHHPFYLVNHCNT